MKKDAHGQPGRRWSVMWSRLTGRPTLQLRVEAAVVVIFVATLLVFTAIDLAGERSAFLRAENRHALVMLSHLAVMAEAQPTRAVVARQVASLNVQLRSVGGDVALIPPPSTMSQDAHTVASRRLLLDGQPYEMRYRLHERTMRQAAIHAIGLHLLHGLIAVAAIVAATELLVRRRLIRPLALITHQLTHMRKGGGWIASLPSVDPELTPITEAIRGLGPDLEQQVKEWVETERRAGIAMTLIRIENHMREPLHRAQSRIHDLEAGHAASDDMENIRSLREDIDLLSTAVSDGRLWADEFVVVSEEGKQVAQARSHVNRTALQQHPHG